MPILLIFNKIITFLGNMIVYKTSRDNNREKYFYHFSYKVGDADSGGNKNLSILFFSHKPRLFHILVENLRA